jgi:peptidylprolyl isomerase
MTVAILASACGTSSSGSAAASPGRQPSDSTANSAIPAISGTATTTPSGLQYIDSSPGDGPPAAAGQTVRVHYTGWLESNGHKFDSSVDRGEPFTFKLGTGQVIKGWDEGVASMKVGGKRRLIIPPDLAYGAAGRPGIPASSTLIFDVELLGIQ